MRVGDLVREKGLQERTGVVIKVLHNYTGKSKPCKVLWNKLSPTSPTMIGHAWVNQLEVINESR